MLSKVFTSSTVPEYQDCLTTCLRAWDLDKHPKVTISFSDNVVHRLPHVAAWFTQANPLLGFNRDINRIVEQNDSNTAYIIREDIMLGLSMQMPFKKAHSPQPTDFTH